MPLTVTPEDVGRFPPFDGLTEQEKAEIISLGKIRYFSRGQMLLRHSDKITHLYIVCRGMVQLFRANLDGREKTVDIITAGNTIFETEIFEPFPTAHYNALALDDVVVMELPIDWIINCVMTHDRFGMNILSTLALKKIPSRSRSGTSGLYGCAAIGCMFFAMVV